MENKTDLKHFYAILDKVYINREDFQPSKGGNLEVSNQLAAHICWMDIEPMIPERIYSINFTNESADLQITDLSYKLDTTTLSQLAAKKLELSEIGYCKLSVSHSVSFISYSDNYSDSSFLIIDKLTKKTVGAGVIDYALRRADNISWYEMNINQEAHSRSKLQKPCVLWFTGLSGSGKSTIADQLQQKLHLLGKHTALLDGDNVRHGLNKDLGFTDQDRVENIRRIAEVSKLMVSSGLITLVSFISPFRSERVMARELLSKGEFIEIYIDTPIEICEARDSKGLYKKARSGKLKNFTGIDSAYEAPEKAEIILHNSEVHIEDLVDQILDYLKTHSKI